MTAPNRMLLEGVSDAVGFVGGALAGYWLGRLFGLDVFAPGYGTASILGILLVGLGGGLGLQAARRWRAAARQAGSSQDKQSPWLRRARHAVRTRRHAGAAGTGP
jgi:predicted lipid-binding transport protein (Tim44 family)